MAYGRGSVKITGGEVWLAGEQILAHSHDEIRKIRGRRVAYVSQSPPQPPSTRPTGWATR